MSGLPSITITFTSAARAVSRRAGQGIVAMVLTDAGSNTAGIYHIAAEADIPEGLGVNNKAYIARALTGNVNRPAKIIALVKTSSTTIATALASLALYDFDWIVGDPDLSTADAATIKTWIATQRADYDKIYKAVLPNVAADSESIVNFAAEDIKVGSTTYDTEAFCSRIAGIIAGTPLKQSITNTILPEVSDVKRMSKEEANTAINAGKLILVHDGIKVKLGRGITSLTTTTSKSKLLKKIGDAGAALGLDQSGMSAIATYLGRMKSTGKVTMEYLNPLLERGIPVWDYLAAASGKTNKEVQEMVSKGLVPGEKAAAALADYMGADFVGSMEKQAKTYAGLTSTLQGMQDEMDVAMGEGYNEQRKLGIQAEIDWLSGDSGDKMKEANRLVGEWQASLENEKERLLREALDDVMNSDEFAGADDINKGRMIEEARAKAQAEYYQNDRYQRQLEADKELISKIRTEMADAYYDAGYSLGLEFDKGLIAARIDNSGLGGDNSVNWAAVSERTKRAMYGNRNKTAGRSSRRSRRAYGIDRVPYDGFSATLHEGERVLTAAQARAQDSAGGGQIIISGNQFMVREDADIDRIATELYHKIADAKSGYIGEVSLV